MRQKEERECYKHVLSVRPNMLLTLISNKEKVTRKSTIHVLFTQPNTISIIERYALNILVYRDYIPQHGSYLHYLYTCICTPYSF